MTMNGVWKMEMFGPYGWEPMATAFLEDGIYRAGSENHYAAGNYEVSDNRIVITVIVEQYGKVRTVYGKKKKKMNVTLEGEIEGDRFEGKSQDESSPYQISFRASRIANLS